MSMDRFMDAMRVHASALDNGLAQPRLANISSFDPATHSVRVRIMPEDVLTGWMPLGAVSVGSGVGVIAPPSAGDQVLVVPQEGDGDTWHVVGRMFHSEAMPPTSTATMKPVQSGEVALVTKGATLHMVGDTVHIHAAHILSEGEWLHKGSLTVEGGITAMPGAAGAGVGDIIATNGSIKAPAGDVQDRVGTVDRLRGHYDGHDHRSRSVGPTTQPDA